MVKGEKMKVYNLPKIILSYFEKIEEWGITYTAIENLANINHRTLMKARDTPECVSVATAQKIINAVQTWSNIQVRPKKPTDF